MPEKIEIRERSGGEKKRKKEKKRKETCGRYKERMEKLNLEKLVQYFHNKF